MKNNPIIDLAALYDEVSDMITERLVIEGAIKLDHNLFLFNDNIVDVQLTVSKNTQTVEDPDQDPDAEPDTEPEPADDPHPHDFDSYFLLA